MFIADSKPAPFPEVAPMAPVAGDAWQMLIEPVESFLGSVSTRLAEQVDAFDPALAEYARYVLNGHGKHLRPSLMALSAGTVGEVSEDHVTAAVVIEMVHLATLVHDDVMDEARIRRNLPTVAAKWGNETAVLFGDCLFAEALRLAASFPTTEVCRTVSAASNTVCAGEILQTRNRGNFELSLEDYLRMIDMKTAELFALSCDLAAFLSNASKPHRSALGEFGRSFGLAYQIFDDCQDVFGTEREAGKSLGTDLVKGKLTLPMIELRRRVSNGDLQKLEQVFINGQTSEVSALHDLFRCYDVLPTCRAAIMNHLETARNALGDLVPGDGVDRLARCTHFLESQVATFGQR